MPHVTIEISEEDAEFLIKKTKSKWYIEKAWNIFVNANLIALKKLENEKWINI